MRIKRAFLIYTRDAILFFLGVIIILKQAGIGFPPPQGGIALELLFLGALFCNGPLFLSYLNARSGTRGSSSQQPLPQPELPPSRQSEPSSESGSA